MSSAKSKPAVTWAIVWDDGTPGGVYRSRDRAEMVLLAYVAEYPDTDYEIGIRRYELGWPAGEWRSAREIQEATGG